MGTNIASLIQPKIIKIEDLKGKIVAVDAFNMLYQFLTTIRQQDGSYLTDSKGNVTSHLSGLFSRTTNMMQKGIKLVFVFDGEAPELKKKERERRKSLKEEAQVMYERAVKEEDIVAMKKYAGRTARLTSEMISESKDLLVALGVPIVQAPSEGEAQVAQMVIKGQAYAGISQDYDSLIHGNPRVVRNLSIAGKRKRQGAIGYKTIQPEQIDLSEVLNNLGIDREKLIWLSVLVGTDYNYGGVKGIGPKKALKLVKNHNNVEATFNEIKWPEEFPNWEEVIKTIKEMPVLEEIDLNWASPDEEKVKEILCHKHEFSNERIDSALKRITESAGSRAQTGLGEFF